MSLFTSATSSAPDTTVKTQTPVTQGFSIDDVKQSLPTHLRSTVTQSLVDSLNAVAADPMVGEQIRNNFVSYSSVLKEGKFKTEDYLNAVSYVSYKIMGYTNDEAWARTFPQKYNLLMAKGISSKDRSAHVYSYNKGKLVNLIMEQTLVPTWVLNQDLYQKALNVQADLMMSALSEKVRTDAANSLLTHLAKPKENNLQINIGDVESSGMKELTSMMRQLAEEQRSAIEKNQMKTIDVAAMRIIKDESDNE